jgi:hypothetical protein
VLNVGGCQIYVELAEGVGGVGGGVDGKKKKSPLTMIALLILLPAGGYMFLADDAGDGKPGKPPRAAPELWEGTITQCQYAGPQSIAFARERMAVADAKRERRPFHIQDGVKAVPIYEMAAACFRAGGDASSGALADESAKFLRREMNDDFRTRRVRLEHALTVEDYVSAQKEVRVLLQFTEGKSGEYVTWLSNLERKLKIKVSTKT